MAEVDCSGTSWYSSVRLTLMRWGLSSSRVWSGRLGWGRRGSWRSRMKMRRRSASGFIKKYHGGRYSFGYPACPNLNDQTKLFELLNPQRIKVSLTEEYQLVPEQSTSAIVVHHPEAKYFNVQ